MSKKDFEKHFIELVDGSLQGSERDSILTQIESDPDLKRSFEKYRELIESERALSERTYSLSGSLVHKVMNKVNAPNGGAVRRLYMVLTKGQKRLGLSLATVATLTIAVKLAWQTPIEEMAKERIFDEQTKPESSYPGGPVLAVPEGEGNDLVMVLVPYQEIQPGTKLSPSMFKAEMMPKSSVPANAVRSWEDIHDQFSRTTMPVGHAITQEFVTGVKPPNSVIASIPPGYRAVTIQTDSTSAVEGWAQPSSNVDITWNTKAGGKGTTATIVQNAKILSAERQIDPNANPGTPIPSTVTLLVPEQDAQKLTLAQSEGSLSVQLRAQVDAKNPAGEIATKDLLGSSATESPRGAEWSATIRERDGSIKQLGTKDGKLQANSAYEERTAEIFKGILNKIAQATPGTLPNSKPVVVIEREPSFTPEQLRQLSGRTNSVSELESFGFESKPAAPGVGSPLALNQQSGEQYLSTIENSRVAVSEEPTSTFSIDVDTGSYTNARRYLSQGSLPPKDSVRIEEFLNYFDYNYPVQYEQPFSLSYELAPSPFTNGRFLLKLGVKAKDVKNSEKPWNLIFLVDVSGSMQDPNKLDLVKKALHVLVDKMRNIDKVGIVTYAGNSGVALEPTGINEKSKILSVIDSLGAGGSTCGSAGIEDAYTLAEKSFVKGGVNRIILATDGDFNVGVTDHSQLEKIIEEKRKSGITLTTVGVGEGNYNETTMEQLANKGNGNYFYLDNFAEARKVFEQDLFGTIEVVAKDVKLQLEFNPEHVAEYRLVGYENRRLKNNEFNNDAVDAGEIGSSHTVTALYEIVLSNSELAKQISTEYRYRSVRTPVPTIDSGHAEELGFLKVRFKEPEGAQSKLLTFPIERKFLVDDIKKASDDFRFAAAVSLFGHMLRGSQFAPSCTYNDIAELAQSALGADTFGYRREFVQLVRNAASLSSGVGSNIKTRE